MVPGINVTAIVTILPVPLIILSPPLYFSCSITATVTTVNTTPISISKCHPSSFPACPLPPTPLLSILFFQNFLKGDLTGAQQGGSGADGTAKLKFQVWIQRQNTWTYFPHKLQWVKISHTELDPQFLTRMNQNPDWASGFTSTIARSSRSASRNKI